MNESKYMTNGSMSAAQEAKFNKDADKHFKSHPELPNGRDFRFNSEFDASADKKYRDNFDTIFSDSPGVGM